MKRNFLILSSALILVLFAGGVWGDEIYLDCGENRTSIMDRTVYIVYLDLENEVYERYTDPTSLLAYRKTKPEKNFSEGDFSLRFDAGRLVENSLTSIELGDHMIIDRIKLTLRFTGRVGKKTLYCKLIKQHDYLKAIKEWQAFLNEEKKKIMSQKKF